ncbi:ADP-ribose 1''-phosphate phosphatase [Friedmanniomyces endolithicus]|uniref:ADP-ribose 1''-phosphate phosphatase n=1 Tax=Friedmanniomyces endolithicus TaxID=329885 RepID=A0AAN6L4Y9_9PEZI|nr:ADP-ribose 1''-phosphate phosphatase [Friedmanniomyces endolithicus]KAK0277570.1 ADP-ribose 1''-phosphate phosphatase [Friedmanniomyces endolithicus]KAK0319939.1 ADP-ribose 1''-phosphate phosphatase [Friedmanniomyces endolithicus]KAK0913284.1 ADP-ribose 1''-phosphate phosphatase [Friedmanniomyces endolithicus]KAK0975105.1 ADP-ribose 1''-phosphate phosphatase [Friedmanniomyces endolithicus]
MATATLDSWIRSEQSNTSKKRKSTKPDDKPTPPKYAKTDPNPEPSSSSLEKTKSDPKQAGTATGSTLKVIEETGDLFAAPPNTLLVHACNCTGSWSAGIAKAFQTHYPAAYKQYSAYCAANPPEDLIGTALLIPPEADSTSKHFVGCLFTSRHYGRRKDSPAKILEATGPAMRDLLRLVGEFNAGVEAIGERVGDVWMCRINSGLFRVPWVKTRGVLEGSEVGVGDVGVVKVVSLEEG